LFFRYLFHDMSKFLPDEFFPYARYWGKKPNERTAKEEERYEKARLLHKKRNKHHWEHWIVNFGIKTEYQYPKAMDRDSLIEMIDDWRAAALAYSDKDNSKDFYIWKSPYMKLHPETRRQIENYFGLNVE